MASAPARALIDMLARDFAHPSGGNREDREAELPLRANPHMHLLEAALVWLSIDDDAAWRLLADRTVALCLDRFIDAESGAPREFFAPNWMSLSGVQGGR